LNGQLYELDGLQPAPISHGPCTKDDFADKLLPVVTRRMRSDPDGGISYVLLAMVKDPRIMAQQIGDEETIRRENAKRKAWKWENDLRQHNFMGFIHEVLKEVITTKVKAGEYDKWIQDAKDKNEERREERRMAREDKMEF
jgi:ubiquitin carboxyl-terminal hydrolase L5